MKPNTDVNGLQPDFPRAHTNHVDASVAFLLNHQLCNVSILPVFFRNKTLTNCVYRPPAEFIPPAEQPYQYIIFRASEVKDLAVDPVEAPPPRRSVHDDPAVLGVSTTFLMTLRSIFLDEKIADVKWVKPNCPRALKPCGCFRCLPSDSVSIRDSTKFAYCTFILTANF